MICQVEWGVGLSPTGCQCVQRQDMSTSQHCSFEHTISFHMQHLFSRRSSQLLLDRSWRETILLEGLMQA